MVWQAEDEDLGDPDAEAAADDDDGAAAGWSHRSLELVSAFWGKYGRLACGRKFPLKGFAMFLSVLLCVALSCSGLPNPLVLFAVSKPSKRQRLGKCKNTSYIYI